MISSNTPSSVNWTTSSAPVSPAVPAVMAVAPAAPASRDAQAGLEQRRGQARAVPAREPAAPAAKTGADRRAEAAEQATRSERLEAERERSLQREQAQRETMEQLRQTLRRVWDASGAVVEQALARDQVLAREQEPAGAAGAGRARPVDAYETPAEPADRPAHLSKRV